MNSEYRETFSVQPKTVLKVFNSIGNITFNSWDHEHIEVEALIKRHWWTCFLKKPGIDVTTGSDFIVKATYPTLLSRIIPIHFRISVPKAVTSAQVKSSTGNVIADDFWGDIAVKTSTGNIRLRKVQGQVRAETGTGGIQAEEVSGDADAGTSTGAIRIHKVKGFVKAGTSTGKIEITSSGGISAAETTTGRIFLEIQAIRNNLDVRSDTGYIEAFLSPGISAQLNVSTVSGRITYGDLPLAISELTKTSLTGKLGNGGKKINFKTSTGSVSLKRMAGEAE